MRIALFVIALLYGGAVFAQTAPRRLSGRPSCASCRIIIADTISIGKPSDPILLEFGTRIAITSTNIFATGTGAAPIAIYDLSGRFLAPFGRLGNGPGEIRRDHPVLARGLGDSLYVATGLNAHLYSPGRILGRTFTMPSYSHFAILTTGRIAITGGAPGRGDTARAVFPAHLVSANGALLRSFGSVAKYNPAWSWCGLFAIGAGANGTAWTFAPNRYELTQWDTIGRLLDQVLVQNSPWFAEWDCELQSRNPGAVVRVMEISHDAAGILWIRAGVPLPDRGSSRGGAMVIAPSPGCDQNAGFAMVIEAYDTNRHELLASLRFEQQDVRLLPGGMLASIRCDSSGYVRFMVGKLTVSRS